MLLFPQVSTNKGVSLMAVIVKCSVRTVFRPPSSRLKTTYGDPLPQKPHVIVSLEDSEGNVGYGEATPLPKFNGATQEMISLALEREFLPLIKGREAGDIASIIESMDAHLPEHGDAKCAIDLALHDLYAKELGVPEFALLGGHFRNSVGVNRHIGIGTVAEAVALARKFVEDGFDSIKMKIGLDPDEDIRRVQAVREVIGTRALRLDANQGYSLTQARYVLGAIENCQILFCEQPLRKGDFAGLKELRRSVNVPLAADESLTGVESALRLAGGGCVDVFTIKLIKCGGLYRARQIAAIAEAAGIECVVTSTFDTQLGAAHCLHLATALRCVPHACDLTCYASQGDQGTSAHVLRDGRLSAGQVPGCGVTGLVEMPMPARV